MDISIYIYTYTNLYDLLLDGVGAHEPVYETALLLTLAPYATGGLYMYRQR